MFTKCPECQAIFRVTEEQLGMAEGLVRCGICDAVFDGRENIEEGQDPVEVSYAQQDYEEQSNNLDHEQDFSVEEQVDTENEKFEGEDELIEPETIPTVIRDDFGGNVLSKTNSSVQIAVFTLGAIALALFLLGQISYWQNVDLLPRTWINYFCKPFGCGDDEKSKLDAIKILNRNVYTHPNAKKALMITVSFVNQAQTAQPYPQLQISLLDTQGQKVAMRRFSPKDYLVNKSLVDTLMLPNQPVGARLEVQDPGNLVIAYEFEFF